MKVKIIEITLIKEYDVTIEKKEKFFFDTKSSLIGDSIKVKPNVIGEKEIVTYTMDLDIELEVNSTISMNNLKYKIIKKETINDILTYYVTLEDNEEELVYTNTESLIKKMNELIDSTEQNYFLYAKEVYSKLITPALFGDGTNKVIVAEISDINKRLEEIKETPFYKMIFKKKELNSQIKYILEKFNYIQSLNERITEQLITIDNRLEDIKNKHLF